MKGQHKPGYRKPRTGEKRHALQPLHFDRLPLDWQEKIFEWLRAKSVPEVEQLTATLDWKALDAKTRALFRRRNGSYSVLESALYRVRDLRIEQKERAIEVRAASSERIAAKWAATGFKDLPKAVQNKLADFAFQIEQHASEGNEAAVAKLLIEMGWLFSDLRKSEVQAEKLKLEKDKLDARRESLQAQSPREVYLAAVEELLKQLRTRKAVREVLDPIAKELIEELSKSAESFTKRIEAQQS